MPWSISLSLDTWRPRTRPCGGVRRCCWPRVVARGWGESWPGPTYNSFTTRLEIAAWVLRLYTVVRGTLVSGYRQPYSLYRKLGKHDDELVKTNMTLIGVGTDSSIKAKGVTSIVLTIGTKTLAAAFFVADVEGNYSLILGRDWIHANQCIPSTLHQMLLQWVGDNVEQVHADASACIAMADALYFGPMRLLRVSQE
jgi:hypothetical protein